MAQWGADMAVKWMVENWYQFNPGAKSEERAFMGARYRHKDFRDERASVGTGVHNYIEGIIKGTGPFLDDLDVEQQQMIAQFEDAVFTTGMEFLDSELTVWGGDWAGTLDARVRAYSERLGRVASGVVDFKTSKAIYPEVGMQLAALKSAPTQFRQVDSSLPGAIHLPDKTRGDSWWLEEDSPEVETAWILHLRGDFWDGQTFVPAKWEFIEVDNEPYHLARFNAYKAVWWAEKSMKDAGIKLDARLSA